MTPPTRSRAGSSAHAEYQRQRLAWKRNRRRVALRWSPAWISAAVFLGWMIGRDLRFLGAAGQWFGVGSGLVIAVVVLSAIYAPDKSVMTWSAGAEGERRTGRMLDKLERRHGWVILHDRAVPDSQANLDHLVIGPPGLVYVDSKNWEPKRVRTKRAPLTSNGVSLWCGRQNKDKELRTARWEADQAAQAIGLALGEDTPSIQTVVAVHGADVPVGPLQGVMVIGASQLYRYLQNLPAHWSQERIRTVALAAEKSLPAYI